MCLASILSETESGHWESITALYHLTTLKCHCNEEMLFSFSLDSNYIFGKNAPCQLLCLN